MAKDNLFEATVGKRLVMLQTSAEQETKLFDHLYEHRRKKDEEATKKRLEQEKKLRDAIRDLDKARMRRELTDAEVLAYQAAEAQLKVLAKETRKQEAEIEKIRTDARKLAQKHAQNSYATMSNDRKRAYHKQIAEELKASDEFRKKEIAAEQVKLKKLQESYDKQENKDSPAAKRFQTQIAKSQDKISNLENQRALMKDADKRANTYSKLELLSPTTRREAVKANHQAVKERKAEDKEILKSAKSRKQAITEEWKNTEKFKVLQQQLSKATDDNKKAIQDQIAKEEENWKRKQGYLEEEQLLNNEIAEAEKDLADAKKDSVKNGLLSLFDNTAAVMTAAAEKTAASIDSNLDALYGQQGRMEGRLQGSGTSWKDNVADISGIVGMSGALSQKNVVAKMVELVDSGVAYNLELRAFLAETSENIASTFDAANGTLLRMIRLQQSDTTAARLGMEAMLTKLFNRYFEDTSYLASNTSDNIAAAILDVSATLPKNDSLAFEFTVQKWLGSLYSLGMSEQAVGTIAEGLNYLGTGNVSALNSNSALQTLFAMSASRAGGKSYAQMLTTGLNNDDTNKLLKAMVEYLAEIADSQTNYVTKAAYADLFGMSITDLSAFSSLTSNIQELYKQTASYSSLMNETEQQLTKIPSRLNMSQLIDTAIENAEVGAAQLIGSTPFTYGTWKALSVLKDYVGKVEIPGITAAGFGIASGLDILNIAQTAVAGMGLIGSLIKGVSSMNNGGPLSFGNWDYQEYTSRGGGLSILDSGVLQTTSSSSSVGVGGGSSDDMTEVSVETAREQAMESEGITAEEFEEQKEIPQSILDTIGEEDGVTVISLLQEMTDVLAGNSENVLNLLQEIDDRLDPGRVFYTAIAGIISSNAVSDITNLSSQLSAARATANLATESVIENSEGNSATKVNATTNNAVTGRSESSSDFASGLGSLYGSPSELSFEERIAAAVVSGLREYGFSNQLPVQISNIGVIG